MNDSNPYAAPNALGRLRLESISWYTEGTAVYARDGAVLPAVELETGESETQMIAVSRKVIRPSRMQMIPLALSIFAFSLIDKVSKYFWTTFIMAMLVVLGIKWLFEKIMPSQKIRKIRVTLFKSARTVRQEKMEKLIRVFGFLLSAAITLSIAPLYLKFDEPWLLLLGCGGLAGIVGTGIYSYHHRPKVHLAIEEGAWMRLGNVNQIALTKLRQIESAKGS